MFHSLHGMPIKATHDSCLWLIIVPPLAMATSNTATTIINVELTNTSTTLTVAYLQGVRHTTILIKNMPAASSCSFLRAIRKPSLLQPLLYLTAPALNYNELQSCYYESVHFRCEMRRRRRCDQSDRSSHDAIAGTAGKYLR